MKLKTNIPYSDFRILSGMKLRMLRIICDCNQRKASLILDVSQGTISKYESGFLVLSLEELMSLSIGLDLTVTEVADFLCDFEGMK